ncbi:hypothetical protein LOZ39_004851 [Ophidiomyces ophidiicola]|uniref:Uncharacterized protein n=1 Tax=Ophidiomyces ophidiicola TaxID=1387563 RepID=A0ACB8ULY8_9EURO|nr:hypothetical protein LOZ62_006848 [Ophidiomyces ophidiicola]KAI1960183.1 hypothetical protein LOZ56_006814 [Ophidiomyces ophidiicola]KAI1998801.1 hypothetical protein LOZ50_006841 [Ophidiomyces ophidiicola]KAI2022703.1 hypothetical protein LOZ46_001844 [Ophidiomyces ophidiicola]KAI2034433.1 hypothetical protein LOZ45_000390 [Ophidiomyces ophidiicola]
MALQSLCRPSSLALSRLAISRRMPLAIAIANQVRFQSTKAADYQIITPPDAQKALAAQRLSRPVAPHLTIYRWQIGAISSALERLTGMVFSGGLYLFGTAYLVSPYLGWDLSTTAMATAFGALPLIAKAGLKFLAAWPFAFHVVNGSRILVWSSAKYLTNKHVIQTGSFVFGLATVAAAALAFLL